jgi:hypothetical protein
LFVSVLSAAGFLAEIDGYNGCRENLWEDFRVYIYRLHAHAKRAVGDQSDAKILTHFEQARFFWRRLIRLYSTCLEARLTHSF